MSEQLQTPDAEIDIEAIMQQIRQQILARKTRPDGGGEPIVPVAGKRLSPAFYEHLYEVGLLFDQIDVPMLVTKTRLPLVGPLIDRLRAALHRLVLYYVNQVAARQIKVNHHLLQALGELSRELEAADDAPPPDSGQGL